MRCKRSSADVIACKGDGKTRQHLDATTEQRRRRCANDSLKHKGNGTKTDAKQVRSPEEHAEQVRRGAKRCEEGYYWGGKGRGCIRDGGREGKGIVWKKAREGFWRRNPIIQRDSREEMKRQRQKQEEEENEEARGKKEISISVN